MPPRSVKMKRRILGFQRRVWWPKWTPASSSSRMETTDMCVPFGWSFLLRRGASGTGIRRTPAPPPVLRRRVGCDLRAKWYPSPSRGRVRVERVAKRIAAVAPDRRLDAAGPRARAADDERRVVPLQLTPTNERLQAAVRLLRARDDHESGGVPVEPMHDPRPLLVPAG